MPGNSGKSPLADSPPSLHRFGLLFNFALRRRLRALLFLADVSLSDSLLGLARMSYSEKLILGLMALVRIKLIMVGGCNEKISLAFIPKGIVPMPTRGILLFACMVGMGAPIIFWCKICFGIGLTIQDNSSKSCIAGGTGFPACAEKQSFFQASLLIYGNSIS
jgi:hypothetical protein